jgi:hypothetical protein
VARKLGKEQQQLHDALAKLLNSTPSDATAEHRAKQQQLMDTTAQLAKDLLKFSQNAKSPAAQKMAGQAAASADKALDSMKQADAENDNPLLATKARDQAAKLLEQAHAQAEQAIKFERADMNMTPENQLGQALEKGRDQSAQAAQRMKQAPEQAPPNMQSAAQAMQQAASLAERQLSLSRQPRASIPGTIGNWGSQPKSGLSLPKELEQFVGRPWGDLPGELRTRVVNDLRARYGDDYARIIQAYFEALADSRR